ncbi:ABC transporter ATP-binding protein [Ursidibacter arcticus]
MDGLSASTPVENEIVGMKIQDYFNEQTQKSKPIYYIYYYLINSSGSQKPKLLRSLFFSVLSSILFGVAIVSMYPFLMALELNDNYQLTLIFIICSLVMAIVCRVIAEQYDTKGYSHYAAFELRKLLGEKLRKVSLCTLTSFRSGELNSILVQSVNEAAGFAFTLISMLIYGFVIPISVSFFLLFIDYRFSILILFIFIVIIPLYLWRRKAFRRGFSLLAEAQQHLKGESIEFIQGLDILKLTGQTQNQQQKFQRVINDVATIQNIGTKKGERPNFIITSTTQLSLILILIFGVSWLVSGSVDWALLAMLVILMARIADILNFFVQMSSLLEIFVISCEKLEKIMALPELVENQLDKMPTNYNIEYKNLHFSYSDKEVLRNINLYIPENTLNAFVGESGCGKTTLVRMLLRYADPQKGTVLIGGIDIREFSQEQLMSLISVVFQDVYLFQDSVINNIRMAKPSATDEEVISACKQAQCHQFIQDLPMGYQTILNDMGSNFSGGEKQRLAIARAILKNAPILILDEPTASLDTKNELAVQKALDLLVKNRTILVIAHRLSTIVSANQIFVLSNGSIVEKGEHQTLLADNRNYAQYWSYQQNGK